MVFSDIGLVTESEGTKLFGMSPKDMGFKLIHLESQEENEPLNAYAVSLLDVAPEVVPGLRKMRLMSTMQLSAIDHHVRPETQLTASQPMDWFQHMLQKNLDNRPKQIRLSGRATMKTFGDCQRRGDKAQEDRLAAEAAAQQAAEEDAVSRGSGSEEAGEHDPDDELGYPSDDEQDANEEKVPRKQAKRKAACVQVQAPTANLGALASRAQVEPKPKARKAKKPAAAAAAAAQDEGDIAADAESVEEQVRVNDPELLPVLRKHKELGCPAASCWNMLRVGEVFRGSKIGNGLQGVPWQDTESGLTGWIWETVSSRI